MINNRSILANLILKKLYVDLLSIKTMISYSPILAITCMVWGAANPINAYMMILGSFGSPGSIPRCAYSVISLEIVSSNMVSLSRIKSWAFEHLCSVVNFSLQLKHKPCARRRCISSQDSLLKGTIGAALLMTGYAGSIQLISGGRNSFFYLVNCSSFIRAKLIAFFNYFGQNMRMSSDIYCLSPPMKVLTDAFYDHPWSLLPNLSNSW